MEYPRMRLKAIAKAINDKVPGFRAEVVEGYCNTDRRIPGTRLIHPGKGRRGNRIIVRDARGKVVIDHNSAEPYRTNAEVLEKVERLWGRIWEETTTEERLLIERGLPLPPHRPVTNLRWMATSQDWWAKTPQGWYWLRGDATARQWRHAPMGPPGENP